MAGHPPSQLEKVEGEILATPLHVAAAMDRPDQAGIMLSHDEGIKMLEARDSDGMTPLIIAAKCAFKPSSFKFLQRFSEL